MRGASEFGWPKGCKSFQRLTTVLTLALGCCTLLPAPSFGQARGIPPPSVTSMGGGHHLAFPPPSVTSMGPYRYGYGFHNQIGRAEERRVGKEGRSRWSPYH